MQQSYNHVWQSRRHTLTLTATDGTTVLRIFLDSSGLGHHTVGLASKDIVSLVVCRYRQYWQSYDMMMMRRRFFELWLVLVLAASAQHIAAERPRIPLSDLLHIRGNVTISLEAAYDHSLIVRHDATWKRMATQPPYGFTSLFEEPQDNMTTIIPACIGLIKMSNTSIDVHFAAQQFQTHQTLLLPLLANQAMPLQVTVSSTATLLALAWPYYRHDFKNETGLVQIFELARSGSLRLLQGTSHLFAAPNCTSLGQNLAIDDNRLALTCRLNQHEQLYVAKRSLFTFDSYTRMELPSASRRALGQSASLLGIVQGTLTVQGPDGCLYHRNAIYADHWGVTCVAAHPSPEGVQPANVMLTSPTSPFLLEYSMAEGYVQPIFLHQGAAVRGLQASIHGNQASTIAFNNDTLFIVDLAMQELLMVPLGQLSPTQPTTATNNDPGSLLPTINQSSTTIQSSTSTLSTTAGILPSIQPSQRDWLTTVLVAVVCSLVAARVAWCWARRRLHTHHKLLSLVTDLEGEVRVCYFNTIGVLCFVNSVTA